MKVSELKADTDVQFRDVRSEMAAGFQEVRAEMDVRFQDMRTDMAQQFQGVDARLDQIDGRLEQIDERFTAVDERFEGIDRRLDALDKRITDEAIVTRRHFDVVAEDLRSQFRAAAERSEHHARHLASISSENVTLLSALSDHELRLRVLEGTRGHQR